ncbi:MAG: flotillin family protein [Planctomycetota bacterium]|nr:flotillin family protein [Planctomycetaceae bacterium]MDQ3329317.1 flotillin family protein [Planctomycetota bacterium]
MSLTLIPAATLEVVGLAVAAVVAALFVLIAVGSLFSKFYRKVGPEEAIVISGKGGLRAASGEGTWVIPVLHRAEHMDLSVKRIEIHRKGESGLICKDNIRADIEVAFFVRVNNSKEAILQVAQSLGCKRASDRLALIELFDAKFSEALKTVGKHFEFVELFVERDKFKEQILKVIGTDLNGYVLDDCAIDILEQTPVEKLNLNNILDAEGIKKITELTAREHMRSNEIAREKEKVIKKQDVEAAEAIYQLEKQRVEAQEKQKREIAAITSREEAEAAKIREEERLRAESARIRTEEELQVAEQNKDRQIVVARKSKERTEAVETERVEKDRLLEVTERERVVGLASIAKEKEIEAEKRDIQEVIRERVTVERTVVEEQQRIKDTEEFATADRVKRVAVTKAEQEAEQQLVMKVKEAEASKRAAELHSDQIVIEAEAQKKSAEREMAATKMHAEGKQAQHAAEGLAEAQVISAKADALEKQGTAEAEVLKLKFVSEAEGIREKAEAMKLFDGVGKEHEEFKLRLNKDKDIEIAAIDAQRQIADAQSRIVGEALKSAKIDIVGGETTFFDKIVDSITSGKRIDRMVEGSRTLTDVKDTFFNGDGEHFQTQLRQFVGRFNMSFDDIKDLSVAALVGRMISMADDDSERGQLKRLLNAVRGSGSADKRVSSLGLNREPAKN